MFRRTWGLAKSSMTVIRLDRELLVLPVLNAVAAVIFALLLWLVASGLGVDFSGDSDSDGGIGIIVLVVFALIGVFTGCNVFHQLRTQTQLLFA